MIKAYKDYWRGYADFSGRTSVSGYWWFVLANFIVTFILSFIQSLLLTFVGDQTVVSYLIVAFQFINILPSIAIVVRRLRDAGLSWANIFCMFLPLAGPIILIVKLCKPSVPSAYLNIRQKSPPELGPGYIAAGVLLLWFAFEDFAHAAFAGGPCGQKHFLVVVTAFNIGARSSPLYRKKELRSSHSCGNKTAALCQVAVSQTRYFRPA
ncbi:MAG: DUF805 domain-containing protein [Ruminococcaceae bacterium]|nr:DUF805 domain-containing protein [Oscillospiraceae bacterium]